MINKVFLAKFQESFPSSEFTVTSQSSGAYAVVINAQTSNNFMAVAMLYIKATCTHQVIRLLKLNILIQLNKWQSLVILNSGEPRMHNYTPLITAPEKQQYQHAHTWFSILAFAVHCSFVAVLHTLAYHSAPFCNYIIHFLSVRFSVFYPKYFFFFFLHPGDENIFKNL